MANDVYLSLPLWTVNSGPDAIAVQLPLWTLDTGPNLVVTVPSTLTITSTLDTSAGVSYADDNSLPSWRVESELQSDGISASIPQWVIEASLEPALSLPSLIVEAFMYAGEVSDAQLTLPFWDVESGLEPALSLPALIVQATLLVGTDSTAANTELPSWSVEASLEPALKLPALEVEASVNVGEIGTASVTLPSFDTASQHLANGHHLAAVTMPVFSAEGAAVSTNLITGAVSLPTLQVAAELVRGVVATAEVVLPLWDVSASEFPSIVGEVTIQIPLVQVASEMSSSVAAEPILKSVVLNARTNAVSTYDNTPFNSMAFFNGVVVAASAAGVVALTGTTDDGVPISARLKSGKDDAGTDMMKRATHAYMRYRADGDLKLTFYVDEKYTYSYIIKPQATSQLHTSRVAIGKGLQGTYWQWQLENQAGCDFDIDHLFAALDELTRRVRS